MNKVDATCRPAASLKFTIDNILNLKTSGRTCDSRQPAGLLDGSAAAARKAAFQSHSEDHEAQRRPDPDSRLNESGEEVFMKFLL